ncbi:MAG: GNAT family N-acetyltransferase [Betaproteobacteria bacterium]|nr:GNAT family N-acetyltransferase [Betaproteobacteria bacterium]
MALTHPIRVARGEHDVELARSLFREYAAWLGVDLCFQGFEEELAALPGKYASPLGILLLAGPPGDAVGCAALRPLPRSGSDSNPALAGFAAPVGEVKRLYVQPRARGTGAGRALAGAVVDAARAIGYRTLCLDTLERMTEARALYESLGFVRCARYYDNPLADACYYALDLHAPERSMTP